MLCFQARLPCKCFHYSPGDVATWLLTPRDADSSPPCRLLPGPFVAHIYAATVPNPRHPLPISGSKGLPAAAEAGDLSARTRHPSAGSPAVWGRRRCMEGPCVQGIWKSTDKFFSFPLPALTTGRCGDYMTSPSNPFCQESGACLVISPRTCLLSFSVSVPTSLTLAS